MIYTDSLNKSGNPDVTVFTQCNELRQNGIDIS